VRLHGGAAGAGQQFAGAPEVGAAAMHESMAAS
jgi:hypothetical protein